MIRYITEANTFEIQIQGRTDRFGAVLSTLESIVERHPLTTLKAAIPLNLAAYSTLD
jgi:hypothetical protein